MNSPVIWGSKGCKPRRRLEASGYENKPAEAGSGRRGDGDYSTVSSSFSWVPLR